MQLLGLGKSKTPACILSSYFTASMLPDTFPKSSCSFYFDQGCAEETVKHSASRTASAPREVENAPRGDAYPLLWQEG